MLPVLKTYVPKTPDTSLGSEIKSFENDLKRKYGDDVIIDLKEEEDGRKEAKKKKKKKRSRSRDRHKSKREGLSQTKINTFFVKTESNSKEMTGNTIEDGEMWEEGSDNDVKPENKNLEKIIKMSPKSTTSHSSSRSGSKDRYKANSRSRSRSGSRSGSLMRKNSDHKDKYSNRNYRHRRIDSEDRHKSPSPATFVSFKGKRVSHYDKPKHYRSNSPKHSRARSPEYRSEPKVSANSLAAGDEMWDDEPQSNDGISAKEVISYVEPTEFIVSPNPFDSEKPIKNEPSSPIASTSGHKRKIDSSLFGSDDDDDDDDADKNSKSKNHKRSKFVSPMLPETTVVDVKPVIKIEKDMLDKKLPTPAEREEFIHKSKIADIVIKYLTPYYKTKITSKELFKALARHVTHKYRDNDRIGEFLLNVEYIFF